MSEVYLGMPSDKVKSWCRSQFGLDNPTEGGWWEEDGNRSWFKWDEGDSKWKLYTDGHTDDCEYITYENARWTFHTTEQGGEDGICIASECRDASVKKFSVRKQTYDTELRFVWHAEIPS